MSHSSIYPNFLQLDDNDTSSDDDDSSSNCQRRQRLHLTPQAFGEIDDGLLTSTTTKGNGVNSIRPIQVLKRPGRRVTSSTGDDPGPNDDDRAGVQTLTFEQREVAYEEARRRIFGSPTPATQTPPISTPQTPYVNRISRPRPPALHYTTGCLPSSYYLSVPIDTKSSGGISALNHHPITPPIFVPFTMEDSLHHHLHPQLYQNGRRPPPPPPQQHNYSLRQTSSISSAQAAGAMQHNTHGGPSCVSGTDVMASNMPLGLIDVTTPYVTTVEHQELVVAQSRIVGEGVKSRLLTRRNPPHNNQQQQQQERQSPVTTISTTNAYETDFPPL